MTDLEGRALDEALARARGWTELHPNAENETWGTAMYFVSHLRLLGRNPTGVPDNVPAYHADVTALLRDIEPVCRERGMVDVLMEWATTNNASRPWRVSCSVNDEPDAEFASGPTAATALARVFLAVLTRGER